MEHAVYTLFWSEFFIQNNCFKIFLLLACFHILFHFNCQVVFHCTYMPQIVYSSTCGVFLVFIYHKQSCFVNIPVQPSVWTHTVLSLGWTPRSGMARSREGMNMIKLPTAKLFSKMYCLTFPTGYESDSFSRSSPTLDISAFQIFKELFKFWGI